jgi:hypothetical protein
VAARAGSISEERRESLDPPVDGDVVDPDPTLAEELLHVAVRQPVPQIQPHGEDDNLGREPKALER